MRENRCLRAPTPSGSGTAQAPRIVVVSDQKLTRDAIRTALSSAGFTVASLGSPAGVGGFHAARRWITRMRPDFGLLIADLDDAAQLRNAVSVVGELNLTWLVLTPTPPGPAWGALIESGARDVMGTNTGLDDLALTLRRLCMGIPAPPGPARAASMRAWQDAAAERRQLTHRLEALSPREMEILVELHNGDSLRTIAAKVGVSEGTVRSQVRSLLRKLNVTSQLQAVASYRSINDWFAE